MSTLIPIRLEAERFVLTNYRVESNNIASKGAVISFSGGKDNETGKATGIFSGPAGVYDVVVAYFDESDGVASLQTRINGKILSSWKLDQKLGSTNVSSSKNLVRRTIASRMALNPGSTIELLGSEHLQERGRIDYVEFIPVAPAKPVASTPTPPPASPIPTPPPASSPITTPTPAAPLPPPAVTTPLNTGVNAIASAKDLGALNGTISQNDAITAANGSQTYRFTLSQPSDFNLVLDQLQANAQATLMNSNGAVIQIANESGRTSELISRSLSAGTYYLQVAPGETGARTPYAAIFSATPTAATSTNLEVSAATYLGGKGNDTATAAEISPRREIVLAGNFSATPGAIAPISLLGASATSAGQLVRMAIGGRQVLSVTHLGKTINDMEVNRINGNIAVVGDFGVAVLNSTGDRVLWSKSLGNVNRVGIANDGTVATLQGRTLTTWDATGKQLSQIQASGQQVQDVAIHPLTNMVYAVGFDNRVNKDPALAGDYAKYNVSKGLPVQVAFMTAYTSNLQQAWKNWGYQASSLSKDMADTRGYRVAVGRDNMVYYLGESAGGNSIYRWNGKDLKTPTLMTSDAHNQAYNAGASHILYYARVNPTTGDVMQGQFAIPRTSAGKTNAFRAREGSITADEQGNIYIGGQASAAIQNRNVNRIGGEQVGAYQTAEMTMLTVSSDFKTRQRWTPFTRNGADGSINAFAVGYGRAVAFGTTDKGSLITKSALSPDPFNAADQGVRDTYMATWGTSANFSATTGSDRNDTLAGNAGVNFLEGGAGADTLTGGASADVFVYNRAAHGGDTITDFSPEDRLQISALGFGGGLVVGTPLQTQASSTGTFVSGSNPTALGQSGNFLYNTASGVLSFDADGGGAGAAVAIATLQGKPALSASQINIVV